MLKGTCILIGERIINNWLQTDLIKIIVCLKRQIKPGSDIIGILIQSSFKK